MIFHALLSLSLSASECAYTEVESVNPLLRAQLRAMIQRLDPDTVATAAAAGDSTMLREFLARRPSEVYP